MNILIAENSADDRNNGLSILHHMGHDVDFVKNPLSILKDVDTKNYDVIIIDIEITEIDTHEMIRQITEKYSNQDDQPKILVLTSAGASYQRLHSSGLDISGILLKPLFFESLREVLHRARSTYAKHPKKNSLDLPLAKKEEENINADQRTENIEHLGQSGSQEGNDIFGSVDLPLAKKEEENINADQRTENIEYLGQSGSQEGNDIFDSVLQAFEEAQSLLERGMLEQAAKLFEKLNYKSLEEIEPNDALAARVLALQLCILQERYIDALYHADAALDLAQHEPLIHHLAGQAMWAQGHFRTAAEMLIYAAELLEGVHKDVPPFNFELDRAQVFYMAAEACRNFDQEAAAERFYQLALKNQTDAAKNTNNG